MMTLHPDNLLVQSVSFFFSSFHPHGTYINNTDTYAHRLSHTNPQTVPSIVANKFGYMADVRYVLLVGTIFLFMYSTHCLCSHIEKFGGTPMCSLYSLERHGSRAMQHKI